MQQFIIEIYSLFFLTFLFLGGCGDKDKFLAASILFLPPIRKTSVDQVSTKSHVNSYPTKCGHPTIFSSFKNGSIKVNKNPSTVIFLSKQTKE